MDTAGLARAQDRQRSRRQLVTENLERLLAGLRRLRVSPSIPAAERERQLREGMAMAVKLADLLREMAENQAGEPPAA